MRMGSAALLAVVLWAGGGTGWAEERNPPPPLHPFGVGIGREVRVSAEDAPPLDRATGIVAGRSATGLLVNVSGRPRLVPFRDMTRLEVRRPWRHGKTATALGTLVGLVVGALACGHVDSEDQPATVAAWTAGGAALGALASYAIWPPGWEEVKLRELRPPLGPAPADPLAQRRPPPGLRLTLRF